MDLQTAVQRYLRHHRARNSSPRTIEWHEIALGKLLAFLSPGTTVEDLDADSLRAWIAHLRDQGLSNNSVSTYHRSPKAFGKWLVNEEYLPKDPFAKVPRTRQDDVPKQTFTVDEIEKLLRHCRTTRRSGARDFAVIMLLFSTGLRATELCSLRPDDIDRVQQLVTIRRGKGGKFRVVPLGRPVEKALDRYLKVRKAAPGVDALFTTISGQPLTRNNLYATLRWRGGCCGVAVNPHKFRHTSAITYLRNGGKLEALRNMLGHSRYDQTLHYARLAGVDLVEAHETSDPVRSLKGRF